MTSNLKNNQASGQVIDHPTQKQKPKLIQVFADKLGIDPKKVLSTLKATAFRQSEGVIITDEQMMALLIVANQYDLNPFTKEIYAFPDKSGGIVPVVGVDGWSRIINSHDQLDGIEFKYSDNEIALNGSKPCFEWIDCYIYRKDRTRPTVVREFLEEIYREPITKQGKHGPYTIKGPWQTHTKRLSRHKSLIQCARLAFGYTGIYDRDEAERIIEEDAKVISSSTPIEFSSNSLDNKQNDPLTQYELVSVDEGLQTLINCEQSHSEMSTVQNEQNSQVDDQAVNVQSEPSNTQSEFFETSYGLVKKQDAKMIMQMVDFAKENGAWDTTEDSFNSRYKDSTLKFALSELNAASNE